MSELATEQDVYYCYRLLLNREPDPDGKAVWIQRLQSEKLSVSKLVSGFLNSTEFKRLNINPNNYTFGSGNHTLVDLTDFKMYVPTDDYLIGSNIALTKSYEPHVTSLLKTLLKPGMFFVDVGANLGYFSLLAASLIQSEGKVFAFEPSQSNYNYLLLNSKLNHFENIDIYPFAVAEQKSCFEYLMDGSNGAIFEVDLTNAEFAGKVLVRSITLDDTLLNLEKLNVIKTDTEGSEFRVISGAMSLIKKHRPIILSEFSPPMLQSQSKVSGEEYLRKIIQQNYHISVIADVHQLIECEANITKVMKCFEDKKSTHIDLVAYPLSSMSYSM
jgi:FkbM family methyltransferase